MREMSVDEIRQQELRILDEIDRVCEEHGLRYYLAYGSLLGAVRHEGFIPWDDDMDLLMFREDYEVFSRHFDEWKSSDDLGIESPVLGNSPFEFAKVYDKTNLVRQPHVRDCYTTGAWVDIFPLDSCGERRGPRETAMLALTTLRYLATTNPKNKGINPAVTVVKRVVSPVVGLLDACALSSAIDRLAKANPQEDSETVALLCTYDPKGRYRYPRSWFAPARYQFEGKSYCGPKNYDEMLTRDYGDWRVPHPRPMHTMEAYWLDES